MYSWGPSSLSCDPKIKLPEDTNIKTGEATGQQPNNTQLPANATKEIKSASECARARGLGDGSDSQEKRHH